VTIVGVAGECAVVAKNLFIGRYCRRQRNAPDCRWPQSVQHPIISSQRPLAHSANRQRAKPNTRSVNACPKSAFKARGAFAKLIRLDETLEKMGADQDSSDPPSPMVGPPSPLSRVA
jgi:hypothetical protein